MLLQTELESEVSILEKAAKKRSLSKEESKILKSAKASLSDTDSYVRQYFLLDKDSGDQVV